ncbi:MAG: Xylan 1,4-beta-xylosidase, partial [uncultured Acetobacteraceae bacterium]
DRRSRDDLERAEQQVALGPGAGPGLEQVRGDGQGRRAGDPRGGPAPAARARRHVAHRPALHPAPDRPRRAGPRGRGGGPRLPARLEPVADRRVARENRRDPRRDGQARLGVGGGRFHLRRRGGAALGPEAHRRAADGPRAAHPLVQPLRPAAHLGSDDAPPGGRGLLVLPPLCHGAAAGRRHAEAGGRGVRAPHARARPVPVVPLRGPPAGRRRGLDEAARRDLPPHRPVLGRQLPAGRAPLVRPADGGAGRFRRDGHLLLHARTPRLGAAPHQPAAGAGGVRRVLRRHGPALRRRRPEPRRLAL